MEATAETPRQIRSERTESVKKSSKMSPGAALKMSPAAPRALFRLERRRDEMENVNPNQSDTTTVASGSGSGSISSKGTPGSKMTPDAKRHKISPKTPPTSTLAKASKVLVDSSTTSSSTPSRYFLRSAQKKVRTTPVPTQQHQADGIQIDNNQVGGHGVSNIQRIDGIFPESSVVLGPTTATLATESDDIEMSDSPNDTPMLTTETSTNDGVATTPNAIVPVSSLSPSKATAMISRWFPLMEYPENIPGPSRATISKLYQEALEKAPSNDEEMNDQLYVQAAGILSCRDVLLPSLAIEEDHALKQMQRKVQRDAPQFKRVLQESRCHVYQAIEGARRHVDEARISRTQRRQEQLEIEFHDKVERQRLQLQQELDSKRAAKTIQRNQKLRTMQRQFPKNQELWREVVFLLSAVTQLEKEERLWMNLDTQLSEQEQLLQERREQAASVLSIDDVSQENQEIVVVPKHTLQGDLEHSISSISLSSKRIQEGMKSILATMDETDQLRRNLYTMYKNEFQFRGYLGIKNPKGMIQFLSQTQEEDDDGVYHSDGDDDDSDTRGGSSSVRKPSLKVNTNTDTMELSPKSLIRRFLAYSPDN